LRPKICGGIIVNRLKEFVIPFVGLKAGEHLFDFEIGKAFFECFDTAEFQEGNIKVSVALEKQERMLIWDFMIKGTVHMNCDRCFEEFDLNFGGSEKLIVKFGDESIEESDEVVVIPEKAYQFDLSQYIFEFIHLLLPYKKVHGEDKNGQSLCNQATVAKIEEHNIKAHSDPRWDALNKLRGET